MNNFPELSREEIQQNVNAKLDEQKELSFLEQYAMYMGKTKNELAKNGIRPDLIEYLKSVVEHRNAMAHEFLLNCAVMNSLSSFSGQAQIGGLTPSYVRT